MRESTPGWHSSRSPAAERVSHKRNQDKDLDEFDSVLIKGFEELQKPPDCEAVFGKHVALYWQLLNLCQQALAHIEMDKVLLSTQFPEAPYPNGPYYDSNANF